MIDVKLIAKPKNNGGGGTTTIVKGFYGSGNGSSSSKHAQTADRATEADHATNADHADDATRATNAYQLTEDSPTREDFLSAKDNDEAAGEIAFEKGVKFGLDGHDSKYGVGEGGQAVLESVETATIADNIATMIENRVLLGGRGMQSYIDAAGRSHLWVDELMVRVKAYFASLEIRKISYSGGTTLFSNAGSTLAKVVPLYASGDTEQTTPTGWKCYAVADDGTRRTMNWWKVGDQALCQTFNVKEGVSENVQNTYYWRLVTEVGQEELEEEVVEAESSEGSETTATTTRKRTYDYIVLSNVKVFRGGLADGDTETDYIGYDDSTTDAPEVGDVVVQAGSQTDAAGRGNAIILQTSADDTTPGLSLKDATAPAIRMYHGMTRFTWSRLTCLISPAKTYFNTAYFELFSGDDVDNAAPIVLYRGTWDAGTTYHYYDEVSYGGELWVWMDATKDAPVGTAPSEGSGWTKVVAKGEDGTAQEALRNLLVGSQLESEAKIGGLIVQSGQTVEISTDVQYLGTNSLHIVTTEADLAPGVYFRPVAIKKNTQYTLSVWAKGSGQVRLEAVYMKDKDNRCSPNVWAGTVYSGALTDEWTLVQLSFTTGGDYDWLDLVFQTPTAGADLYMSRFMLEEGDYKGWTLNQEDLKGEDGEPGNPGENAVVVSLDNEMDCVGCNANGKVATATTLNTKVMVYDGATLVTPTSVVAGELAGVQPLQGPVGTTTGVSWTMAKNKTMSSDRYTAQITVVYNGETYTKTFTLSVVKAGADGEDARIYQLRPDKTSLPFVCNDGETYTPSAYAVGCGYVITVGAAATQGTVGSAAIDGKYYVYYRFITASGDETNTWSALSASSNYKVTVNSTMTYSALEFCLSSATTYSSVATGNIIDRQRVPIVKSGKKGADGDAGWTVEVSPQVITLSDALGDFKSVGSSYATLSSEKTATVRLKQGDTYKTITSVESAGTTNCVLWSGYPKVDSTDSTKALVRLGYIFTHEVTKTSDADTSTYVPYATALVRLTLKATADDGSTVSVNAEIQVSCEYTAHVGQLIHNDEEFKSTLANYSDTETVKSMIAQSAGNISLTVAKSQVRRNLLQGTAFRRALDGWYWNGTVQQIRVSEAYLGCNALRLLGKTGYSNGLYWNNMALKSGKKYVLSFMYKVTQADWTAYGGSSSKQIAISAILWRQSAQTNIFSFTNQTITASDVGTWKTAKFVTTSEVSGSYTDWACVIYVDGSYNGAAVHICRPILEEGEESYGWGLSEKDADYIGGNLLDNTDTLTVGGNLQTVGTDGNYVTLYTDSETGTKGLSANTTNTTWKTLLRWVSKNGYGSSVGFPSAAGQELVFSFEAKGSGTLSAHLWGGSSNSIVVETDANGLLYTGNYEGYSHFAVSAVWKRYWVHWIVNADSTSPQYCEFRAQSGVNAYIRRPKLEAGALITAWTAGSETAENVDNVYEALLPTGIDISHKKIRVTADQFEIYNNSGEATASVDKNGNLEVNSGLFRGFVMMKPTIITPDNITGYLSSFQPANGYTNLDFSKTGSFVVFMGAISEWTKANLNGNEIQIILPNYGGSLTVGATSSIYDCLPYIGCRFILVNATSAGSYGYATININGGTNLTSPLASGKNAVGNGYMAVVECSFRYSTTSPGVVWSGYNVPHGLSSIPTTQSDEDAEISVASEEADGADLSETSEEGKS